MVRPHAEPRPGNPDGDVRSTSDLGIAVADMLASYKDHMDLQYQAQIQRNDQDWKRRMTKMTELFESQKAASGKVLEDVCRENREFKEQAVRDRKEMEKEHREYIDELKEIHKGALEEVKERCEAEILQCQTEKRKVEEDNEALVAGVNRLGERLALAKLEDDTMIDCLLRQKRELVGKIRSLKQKLKNEIKQRDDENEKLRSALRKMEKKCQRQERKIKALKSDTEHLKKK